MDVSNGWEGIAAEVVSTRERSTVGVREVTQWAAQLPTGAAVLDLGCGAGGRRSRVLASQGFRHYAIDAAPSLAAAYALAFPEARVQCEPANESAFFTRHFDGIVA